MFHEWSEPVSTYGVVDDSFSFRVRLEEPRHVVTLAGDLDLISRADAARACASAGQVDVVVEMAELTFMDCAGYGALVSARSVLERRGGSLTLVGAVGGPLRLLSLIEQGTPNTASSLHDDASQESGGEVAGRAEAVGDAGEASQSARGIPCELSGRESTRSSSLKSRSVEPTASSSRSRHGAAGRSRTRGTPRTTNDTSTKMCAGLELVRPGVPKSRPS